MSGKTLTHEDANLVLKLYDMRREPVMRKSREILVKFFPKSFEDFKDIANPEHASNVAFRQVGTYWEMAYSFIKYGIIDAEFFLESNGEGIFIFAKLQPFIEDIRKNLNPTAFKTTEWVATETEAGRKKLAAIQARLAKK